MRGVRAQDQVSARRLFLPMRGYEYREPFMNDATYALFLPMRGYESHTHRISE